MLSVNCLLIKPVSFGFNDKNGLFNKTAKPLLSYFSLSTKFVCWVESEKKESEQQFEVDQDKAREALKQLDQQFQSISQKQIRSPKIKASDVELTKLMTREQMTAKDEETEFSMSFLSYAAGALFLFTIFYNILFYKFIKPAIDLPEDPTVTAVERQIIK